MNATRPTWRPELATGLDWQDKQHQEILKQLDQLVAAMQINEGASVVKELMDFLQAYATDHFRDEEQYMLEHNCITCVNHKKCHTDFKTHLAEIRALYDSQGASTMVVLKLQSWLRDWFVSHITSIDKQMVKTSTPKASHPPPPQ